MQLLFEWAENLDGVFLELSGARKIILIQNSKSFRNCKSAIPELSQESQISSPDIIIAFKLAIKRVSHSSIIFALAVLVFLRGRLRLIAGQSLDLIISKAEN